jgi:hypothetical protein
MPIEKQGKSSSGSRPKLNFTRTAAPCRCLVSGGAAHLYAYTRLLVEEIQNADLDLDQERISDLLVEKFTYDRWLYLHMSRCQDCPPLRDREIE